MIHDSTQLTSDVTVDCDVAIVGTGAGGAITARALSRKGVKVVLFEEGGHHRSAEFDMQEATAYPMLYQEQGNRATADLAITVLQGRSVGGGTTVNWTTSFRTPPRVLDHWAAHFGVAGLTEQALAPHWEEIESYLGIAEVPESYVNRNNGKLWEGLGKLGWQRQRIRRNVRGCMNSGYCGMGCPIDAKQSMLITAIPDAVAAGAEIYTRCRVQLLEERRGRIVAVHGQIIDADTLQPIERWVHVKPKVAVLSGGALNSPAVLLRSHLGNESGQVGRRTFLHPTLAMVGFFEEPVEGYYGAPQSVSSHELAERDGRMGLFFEAAPVHPMLASIALNAFGPEQREQMHRLPHTSALIALCIDGFGEGEEGGRVTLKPDGMPRLDYPFSARFEEAARTAQHSAARILLAAGAQAVRSLHNDPVILRSEADLPRLDAAPFGPNLLSVFTAHQMGGCAMGSDPAHSVVRSDLRHHHLENLFVIDGSVFPTSLGVNPQLSIYGLASWASPHVLAALGRS
ncbi:MAG: GMC family oxidoreductase N-terminal domain-containing protein [Myxococcales bacterium]